MSTITINPYLFFAGNCREAMEFYKEIFGGELTVQTYAEVGMNDGPMPADKLMHADLSGGDIKLMGSDTAAASVKAAKVSLSLGGDDEAKLRDIFEKLSEDVTVQYPLKKEFWGDIFGSLTDKFGIEWMVNIAAPKAD
jgi:PhnB protein